MSGADPELELELGLEADGLLAVCWGMICCVGFRRCFWSIALARNISWCSGGALGMNGCDDICAAYLCTYSHGGSKSESVPITLAS